jgi:hypothetical protein
MKGLEVRHVKWIPHNTFQSQCQVKLAENLSNFRAVDSLLQETFTSLHVSYAFLTFFWGSNKCYLFQRNTRRAGHALNTNIPHINKELDETKLELTALAEKLPIIRTEVSDIRLVYDSGRRKVNARHIHPASSSFSLTIITGPTTRLRSRMVRHRFLRTLAYHHLHLVEPCLMALESPDAATIRPFFYHVHLHVIYRAEGSL